jgi:capsid assembly protease
MAALATEMEPLALEVFSDGGLWAITPAALRSMLRSTHHPDLMALAARMGQPLEAARAVQNHQGTAVMEIRGPLFRYRSIWTWLLGGTAVSDASLGLHAAVDDPTVRSIVLAINSPGGQIDGINEFANYIRAANAIKPVTAYVEGAAGSGAYWLASAAGRIVADETAQLGSIGVLATIVDDSEADARGGVKRYDVVSSQSPLKRSDPATDEGRAQIQAMVDGLAQTFIDKVAGFRGVDPAKVVSDFGRGAMLGARAAVAVGMADSTGSLQELIGAPATFDGAMQQIRDNPGARVSATRRKVAVVAPKVQGIVVEAPFDEETLEEDTEEQQLNNDANCTCPPGTDTCNCGAAGDGDGEDDDPDDESEGTEQQPDHSSVPTGEALMPNEDRQRIAAILTCEEARGRDELARSLALETDMNLETARRILATAPTARPNALETRMGQLPNPAIGVQGDRSAGESVAETVASILAYVPKDRIRAHARAT